MNILKAWIVLILCILSFACSKNKSIKTARADKDDVITIKIPTNRIRDKPLSLSADYYYDVKYIPLETDSTCLLGFSMFQFNLNEFIVNDIDSKIGVSRFGTDGKFLNYIGRKGKGPGEYLRMSRFQVNDKHFLGYGGRGRGLLKYNLNGQYVGSEEIPELKEFLMPRFACKGETYYFCEGSNYRKSANEKFELQRIKNKVVEKYFLLPDELLLEKWNNNFSFSGGKVFFAPFANDTIYELSESEVIPRYYLYFSDEKYALGKGYIGGLRFLSFYETNTHFGFHTRFNEKSSNYLYCKKSNNILAGEKFDYTYTDNAEAITRLYPSGSNGDYFICVLQPFRILEEYQKLKALNKKIHPKIEKLVAGLKEDDNPVVVYFKVKEF